MKQKISAEFRSNHPPPLFREAEKFLRFFSIGNKGGSWNTPPLFVFGKNGGRGEITKGDSVEMRLRRNARNSF